MTSFGENDVLVDSRKIGHVRIKRIGRGAAVYPRLLVTLGITLHQDAEGSKTPGALKTLFELRALDGELRLTEYGEVVGPLTWAGEKRYIQSSPSSNERELTLACDLDFYRLEQIERFRDGQQPRFWLQLWPTLISSGIFLNAGIHAIEMRPLREDWLAFYGAIGGDQHDIIELRYSARDAAQFERAIVRLREARNRITTGDYDGAVGACRKAIEVFEQELDGPNKEAIGNLIHTRTDAKRAKEYTGIVSRLKQLSGFDHHELGGPITFSRSEAQFLVRCTEALAALLGHFSTDEP